MAQARPKITDELQSLPNNKWEYIIDNYIKNETDRQIAKMYYLDGISQTTLNDRLKRGWTLEQALTISTKGNHKKVKL